MAMFRLHPDEPIVKNNLPKIEDFLKQLNVVTWVVASPRAIQLMVHNAPPYDEMPQKFKEVLIKGEGLLIQKRMVLDYLRGKLDPRNTTFMENCDIRVTFESKAPPVTGTSIGNASLFGDIFKIRPNEGKE